MEHFKEADVEGKGFLDFAQFEHLLELNEQIRKHRDSGVEQAAEEIVKSSSS